MLLFAYQCYALKTSLECRSVIILLLQLVMAEWKDDQILKRYYRILSRIPRNMFCIFFLVAGCIWNFKTRSSAGLALYIVVCTIHERFLVALSVHNLALV